MTLSRSERLSLAGMLAIFTWFTWRALTMHYSGDDVTNMYSAWELNPWRLGKAVFLFWVPIYRPVGGVVYRAFYEFVGFHPEPLKAFCWLLLAANVVFAYRFFRTLLAVPSAAFTALGLTLVHPLFQDLYLNSGTLYDQFWFLFTTLGLTLYAQWRNSEKGLTLPRQALLTLLSILAMSSKESGVSLPVLMGFFELIFHFRRQQPLAPWLRTRGPLFAVLAAITLVDIRRVNLTPVIAMTAEYHAKASLSLWLEHVAGYFTILSAGHLAFTAFAVSFLLLAMAAVGLALKNRPMLFGLAFFVVTITTMAAVRQVPAQWVQATRSFGGDRWRIYRSIYLPAMAPQVMTGLRLGLIFCIIGILLAEMYGSRDGVGLVIYRFGQAYQMVNLMASIFLISFITVAINETMRLWETRLGKWNSER